MLCVAYVFASMTNRDLPIPTSPETRRTCPFPFFASSMRVSRIARSVERPMNTGQITGLWSCTVKTFAAFLMRYSSQALAMSHVHRYEATHMLPHPPSLFYCFFMNKRNTSMCELQHIGVFLANSLILYSTT